MKKIRCKKKIRDAKELENFIKKKVNHINTKSTVIINHYKKFSVILNASSLRALKDFQKQKNLLSDKDVRDVIDKLIIPKIEDHDKKMRSWGTLITLICTAVTAFSTSVALIR